MPPDRTGGRTPGAAPELPEDPEDLSPGTAAERTRQWGLLSAGQVPDDVKEPVPQGGVEK